MYLTRLLTTLTMLGITLAVPVAHQTSIPASTRPLLPTSHAAAPTPVGPYECPPSQYKSCCKSLEQTSKGIMQGLGTVLPILNGVQISSLVSFQCQAMAPNQSPNDCNGNQIAPMCCSNAAGNGGINTCRPFDEVKEEYYRSFGYGSESQVDVINDAVS